MAAVRSGLAEAATASLSLLLKLVIVITGAAFARATFSPVQEMVSVQMQLSDTQVALLQGPAPALPVLIFLFSCGWLLDRFSKTRLLCICLALLVLATACTAISRNFTALLLSRGLMGLAATTAFTIGFAMVPECFAASLRGRANMSLVMGQYLGMAAAFAVGGALADLFQPLGNAWQWSMGVMASLLILPFLAALHLTRRPVATATKASEARHRPLRRLWELRDILGPPMMALALGDVAIGVTIVWTAPFLSRTFSLSAASTGSIMFAEVLGSGLVGSILGGVIADKVWLSGGARASLIALTAMAALSMALGCFPLARSLPIAATLMFFYMATVGVLLVGTISLYANLVPAELRGTAFSILSAVQILFGTAIAPLIISLLSESIGGSDALSLSLCIACVVIGGLSIACYLTGMKSGDR